MSPSGKPTKVTALPSPFVDATRPSRDDPAPARTRTRAYSSHGPVTQVPAVAARAVETAARALAAALKLEEERRAALAFAIATARAAGVPDSSIKARLAVAELDDDEIDQALG